MTVVLVHGNPETTAVWDPLVARLTARRRPEPIRRLSPPGFGAPVPAGFGATALEYRDWLIAELEQIVAADGDADGHGGPVDLVGHDWGGGHTVAVAIARPDLLRSWATDMIGVFAPGYVWHADAQVWQTPGDGEAAVARALSAPAAVRARALRRLGVGDERVAHELADAYDEAMGRCVLALYRSAAPPHLAELTAPLRSARARPGLAIVASEDRYVGTPEQHREAAGAAGARVAELPGLGHWWMTADGARAGADALTEFWDSLPG